MQALEYVRTNQTKFQAELEEFLSIASISTQPEHKSDISYAATWLRDRLLIAGFPKVDVMPTPGHPVVYAEWLPAGDDAPTILIYGHYDVQPPDPLEEWNTPPFEPTIVGYDIFARGAADDKGQLYVHVKAIEAFKETAGAPPINVKCIFEGEEECGSPNLEPFVRENADLLAADVAVISDTHILGKEMPSIVYALRGLTYVEVEVTGPDHDLHSGSYGGAVHNPIHALCEMIVSLQDEDGRITIPGFYDNVQELETEERAELAKAPFEREKWLREAGVSTDWGESAYTIVERTTARPTLDVNGIWGGYIQPGAKTVLPSKAFAKISMRLVPNQDPVEITQLVQDYLVEIAPPAVTVKVRDLHDGECAIVRRDSPAMQAAFRAYTEVFGKQPIFVREGGSIPVVATFQRVLGIETVLMGFGLPDDRLHSPNEKFHLPNFYKGIETAIHFMRFLAKP
ncbi:MAG: dipeptidase [Chloroflexi bacterium]|nr:MAG: dipeptidase [Chloroflexota bacterium]RLC87431.1 MAG: dipeptidase [Chloroflexota bacterium]HEY74377.1 dipeptidase [Thermoflexia bacterium]